MVPAPATVGAKVSVLITCKRVELPCTSTTTVVLPARVGARTPIWTTKDVEFANGYKSQVLPGTAGAPI